MSYFVALKDNLKYGFFLFLCTILIIFTDFIVYVLNSNVNNSMDVLSWGYFVIAALGQASLFATLLYLVAFVPFVLIFKSKKVATSIFAAITVLVQIVLVLDIFVFEIYKFHINGFVIELLLGGGATDIFVFDWGLYLRFGALVLFFAVLPVVIGVFISRKYYSLLSARIIRNIGITLALCIVVSHVAYAVAHAAKQYSIQKSATALPLFFPLTANTILSKWGLVKTDELDKVSYNKTSSDIQYPINPIVSTDSIPNYNIIFIAVDSWNPSVFDSIVCPNITKFAEKGQIFNRHISSNNGTRGSIFGLFFGLSFTYEKEFYMSKMSPIFVDKLVENQYDIKTFPSADFTNPPFHEIIFRRVPGINTRAKGETPFERDNDITKNFLNFLDNRDENKPFFSFLFYDLPHAINIPKEHLKHFQPSWEAPDYINLNNDMDRTPFFNLYKNCVHYDDMLIGKVIAEIEDKGLLDNTVIIITGDHGQEFNENKKNYWGHGSNYSKWQTQVPFVIYYPGIEGPKTIEHTTTHYDITPTVLYHFLGVKNPSSDYSMGYDMWDDTDRFPHVVGDHVKYGFIMHDVIVTTGHTGRMDIWDLDMNEVPRGRINVQELNKAIEKKNMFYKK